MDKFRFYRFKIDFYVWKAIKSFFEPTQKKRDTHLKAFEITVSLARSVRKYIFGF